MLTVFYTLFKIYQQNGRQHRIHLQLWDTAGQERQVIKDHVKKFNHTN